MEALPNELLHNIFVLLHPPITQLSSPNGLARSRHLSSLCRVSHKFRQVATPLLYESIERAGDTKTLAYRHLPQVLLNNPNLRQHIKSIRLKLDNEVRVGERVMDQLTDEDDSEEDIEDIDEGLKDDEQEMSKDYSIHYQKFAPYQGDAEEDIADINEGIKNDKQDSDKVHSPVRRFVSYQGDEEENEQTWEDSDEEGEIPWMDSEEEEEDEEDSFVDNIPKRVQERYRWLRDIIEPLAKVSGLPYTTDLLRNAIRGDDIPITLCIFLAPNIERLWYRVPKIQLQGSTSCLLLTAIALSAFGTPLGEIHRFEKLRILHIDLYRSEAYQTAVNHALPLLLLPSLVDLTLGGWGTDVRAPGRSTWITDDDDSQFSGHPWTWPIRTSSITRLSLIRPNITSTMVAKMLLACRALTRFELVPRSMFRRDVDPRWYEIIGTALLQHVNTLTELSIGDINDSRYRIASGLGSLRIGSQMTSLTSLRSPLYTLLDIDISIARSEWKRNLMLSDALPHGLVHLWLELPRHLDEDVEPYFTGLQKACAEGNFPNLKSVYLHWRGAFDSNSFATITFLGKVTKLRDFFLTCSTTLDVKVIIFSPNGQGT
jgi:hypothetical protein